jgi:hypothetical protein
MAQEKETKQLTVTELTNELQRLFALKPDSYDNKNEWKVLHWVIVQLLRLGKGKPAQLDDLDTWYIKKLRAKYSYDDLGFILDRASSTIYQYCKANDIH